MAGILLHNWFKIIRQDLDDHVVRKKVAEMQREQAAGQARWEDQNENGQQQGRERGAVRDLIRDAWVAEPGAGNARGRNVQRRAE